MLLLRNLIYWLILVIATPLLFVVALPAALFPKGANQIGRTWAKLMMWSLQNIIGLKYRIIGAENIPTQPAIICSKHQSGWETLALQTIFPPQVFVAKKELFKLPFFGWGLKLAKTIGIDRSSGPKATQILMQQGLARKQEGFWITIFPEGTRIAPGQQGRYKLGGARMAKLFEMDMVPVALNSGEFWPKNSFMKYPGEITLVVGPPIAHDSGSPEELMAACQQWIEQQQLQLNGAGPFSPANARHTDTSQP